MAGHMKQALTPEEVIARKGNAPRDDTKRRSREAGTTEITHTAYHPTTYPGDERLVRYTVPDTTERASRPS
jgi:hypothetical protein